MKIQVLVGPIASGKSTYTRNAARNGVICLNDDALVNMLHGDNYSLYDKKLKILYKTVENQVVGSALGMGKTVLVDRGLNLSANGRNRWLALARSFDVPCEAIVFSNEGPEIHANRRFNSDSRGHSADYWLRIAKFHQDEYCPPSVQEGFSSVRHISFSEIQEGCVLE